MRAVRLSPRGETDLEDIWFYTFEHWSIEQADRYQLQFMTAFKGLADGTKIGRSLQIRHDIFTYPSGSHFILYRLTDTSLDVIRILHQRMDVTSNL